MTDYYLIRENGTIEFHRSSEETSPANSTELTPDEYDGLVSERLKIVNGQVVPNV